MQATEHDDIDDDTPRRVRRGHDRGNTFVEIVATIVLIGLTVVGLLNAMFAAVASSERSRDVSEVNTVIQNAADRVNRAPKKCDYTVYVQAAALSQGWPTSTATVTNEYLVPGDTAADAGSWHAGACPGGALTELLVQKVTITIQSPSGRASRTIQVVKSDV